ncbi:MAG TPA: indolepyruvate ferredoxin oxidoreductase family protein [Burkholderiaceae bacterium]|nr:indolepyruvate ferredoxin oxidoreductase family protein [Burkholderiaceae bacterium]
MAAVPHPKRYRLEDNLSAYEERIFLTGTQALVRMLLSQSRRDHANGCNTAGFVSGYRGSPLGGVDQAMWRAKSHLETANIRFVPAINEDLAATMVMGSQQAGVHPQRKVDGVFAMWYGKGPGVDRAGDALHHGHAAGASRHGGVLLVVGDDHTAASSSIPHASDATLASWSIPVIHPGSIENYEYFGLWGWALSRFSGSWVAFKAITETVESGRSFIPLRVPEFPMPPELMLKHRREYSSREFLSPAIEERMLQRLEAVKLFGRHHPLDKILESAPLARLGIISVGKASLDVMDTLARLRRAHPEMPAIRHMQIGLVWPLDGEGVREFARGLDHVLVVEEKATLAETQIKELFYNFAQRPTVYGRQGPGLESLVPGLGQLTPGVVSQALRQWLQLTVQVQLKDPEGTPAPPPQDVALRRPYFCSGCPHSTSTRVPEGSRALGGVGCHYMASWMDRNTSGLTQMGGEGVDWVGLMPFVENSHVFQNMGEGTYFHSGLLAIRQAVAAGADMSYKILFNDAVAMTGGQPVDGPITVPGLCQQLLGEGVRHVVITTDEPHRYRGVFLPAGVKVHHRRELDSLQRALREMKGVTVLIHDQTCAAEKRRRRKKGEMPEPSRRLFINQDVCEGCGDCGVQSNCLSIVPVETPQGRKRAIDQSSCNKDYSCAEGFCPSFVSVEGASLRKARSAVAASHRSHLETLMTRLPEPQGIAARDCGILVVGVGGTGVVTVGAIISMAANLEGRAASVLDITGLAQKGGAVISHVRVSAGETSTGPVRLDAGTADTAILCDAVAALKPEAWQAMAPGRTKTFLNQYLLPPSEFTRDTEAVHDIETLIGHFRQLVGNAQLHMLDAHNLATQHQGDAILANMIMLGLAWQRGAIPVSAAALQQAIELNGVAVEANLQAFRLGRLAAWRPDALRDSGGHTPAYDRKDDSLGDILARNRKALEAYQDARYAQRYVQTITRLSTVEQRLYPDRPPELAIGAARSLFRLMAIKDEYEVARLYTDGRFRRQLEEQFEGDFTVRFHMAPPFLAPKDPHTGRPRKITLGPWLEKVMRVLAQGRRLRGTVFDIFGWQEERRIERRVLNEFEHLLGQITEQLDLQNYALARTMVELPEMLRGFGHVKRANLAQYETEMARLRPTFEKGGHIPTVLRHAHS